MNSSTSSFVAAATAAAAFSSSSSSSSPCANNNFNRSLTSLSVCLSLSCTCFGWFFLSKRSLTLFLSRIQACLLWKYFRKFSNFHALLNCRKFSVITWCIVMNEIRSENKSSHWRVICDNRRQRVKKRMTMMMTRAEIERERERHTQGVEIYID